MKLRAISEEGTRRDFIRKAAGTAATLGSGGLGGLAGGAAKIAGATGAAAAGALTTNSIILKVMTKYYLPSLWDKNENEVIRSLASTNPHKAKNLIALNKVTDKDIADGLKNIQPTHENITGLLDIVLSPRREAVPDWVRANGQQSLQDIITKLGPTETIKLVLQHERFALPHAIFRLENLQANAPQIAKILYKSGLSNLKTMTPQKFDALERLSGTKMPSDVRDHFFNHQKRVEQGQARYKAKQEAQSQQAQKRLEPDQDDIGRWENEGGYAGPLEERLNRAIARMRRTSC